MTPVRALPSPPVAIALLGLLSLLAVAGPTTVRPAHAGVVSHGPVVAFAYSEVKDFQYYIPSFGYRVELAPCERLGNWMNGVGTDLTFIVEGIAAVVAGDDTTAEVQLLPMARFEPPSWQDRVWLPFLELGIGIMYTGLDDIGLGDNVLFSSNVGAGVSIELPQPFPFRRTSIGYRFRHASHAGLLGDKNVGSNSHYLTFTFE